MQLNDLQQKVLRRVQQTRVGLTARDIARSLGISTTDVNRVLLELQNGKQVQFSGNRWKSLVGFTSSIETIAPRSTSEPTPTGNAPPGNSPLAIQDGVPAPSNRVPIDRTQSNWRDFRALCEYYAECVRLDQKSSIHAKAEEEYKQIVCFGGRLLDTDLLEFQVPESWHLWARESKGHDYVFLGYPLHRYQWRDTSRAEDVNFCSPVFIVPCRVEINQTKLVLERLGSIRINEGWLERRLRNVEERKAFFELCGMSTESESLDVGNSQGSWRDVAHLISHYYRDWCCEPLSVDRLTCSPDLVNLRQDGIYNRASIVLPKKFRFTARLHSELLELARYIPDSEIERSAVRWIFPSKDGYPTSQVASAISASELVGAVAPKLNREQRKACCAATSSGLSVVVGPPGTGKSRVVKATLVQQAISGQNALFASRNHQALEAVVPGVNALTEPWPTMLRLARPFGDPVDVSLVRAIEELVAVGGGEKFDDDQPQRERLVSRIAEHQATDRKIDAVVHIRAKMGQQLAVVDDLLRIVQDDKLRSTLKTPAVLPEAKSVESALGNLQRSGRQPWWQRVIHLLLGKYIKNQALNRAREIDSAFRRFLDPGSTWPPAPLDNSEATIGFFQSALAFHLPIAKVNDELQKLFELRESLAQLPDLQQLLSDELKLAEEVESISLQLLNRQAQNAGLGLSNDERSKLAEVLAALRNTSAFDSDSDKRRLSEALRSTFPIFLKHFPLAATTNLSVGRDIPLHSGIYDLLILDEASQCDIASVVPLLFRSKQAMIVGDPMQLSHVTSLSAATDRQLRNQFGLDAITFERFSYRSASMFDLAAASPAVGQRTSLRQHHRCHPEIAEYCNDMFYKGSWTVLTSHTQRGGLKWTHVDDDCCGAAGGGAISELQIQAIVQELKRLENEDYGGTIGVVTPFRQQANRLRDRIFQEFAKARLDSWRMLVDTADGFQGDERQVVLMSLPGGAQLPVGSKAFLANGPNRFNVAVSRAKQLLHVFADETWGRSCGIKHIQNLHERCEQSRLLADANASLPYRSDLVGPVWEPFLAQRLTEAQIPFQQQYPACGRYLDFAIFTQRLKLDVEVDGEQHRSATGGRVQDDIDRDQALVANGWQVLRFWVYELREKPEWCLQKIQAVYTSNL